MKTLFWEFVFCFLEFTQVELTIISPFFNLLSTSTVVSLRFG